MAVVTPGTADDTLVGFGAGGPRRGPALLEVGERVGRFKVLELVGRGEMGEVYAAHDAQLDRKVALKLVRATDRDERRRNRLAREAQAMARLSHPNVITVHDVGQHAERMFVAMEFIEGTTLRAWLETKSRPWTQIVDAFADAGEGLAAAHEHGLVHRDFKPDNVLVASPTDGRPDRVYVTDFGLAKQAASVSESIGDSPHNGAAVPDDILGSELTRDGQVVGTPAYMAPEQYGEGPVGAAADQFAFCVALHEAVYGERPYEGRTAAELVHAVTSGRRRPLPSPTGVPARIRRAIERGLAAAPHDRWPSMRRLLDELHRRPGHRAWPWLGGAAALLAAGSWVLVVHAQRTSAADACAQEANVIASAWDSTRASGVSTALMATRLPFAADTFEKADSHLKAFSADWFAARLETCREANVSGSRTVTELELSRDCLDEQRQQVTAVVDALIGADDGIAQQALSSVVALPRPGSCVDANEIAHRVALPSDDEARAKVREIRLRLKRASASAALGRYDEALQQGERALAEAQTANWTPLLAAAKAGVADAQHGLGRTQEAVVMFEEAYFDASTAGYDEIAARIAVSLIRLEGASRSRYEAALGWHRLAQVHAARAGLEGSLLYARLESAIGAAHRVALAYDEALEAQQRALALTRGAVGTEHPQTADILASIGRAKEGKRKGSGMRELQRALEIRQTYLGDAHPDVASSMSDVAVVEYRTGHKEAALAMFKGAQELFANSLGDEHSRTAKAMQNVANALVDLGRLEEALQVAQRARRIHLREPSDSLALASATEVVAVVQSYLGDRDASLAAMQEVAAIRERVLGADHPHVAAALGNVGASYLQLGEHARAREYAERALEIWERAVGPDDDALSDVLLIIGDATLEAGQPAQALIRYERALSIRRNALRPEHPDIGAASARVGLAHLQLGEYDQAVAVLEPAVELLERGDTVKLADARWTLARALRAAGQDPGRCTTLARHAQETYASLGPARDARLEAVDAFLRK